MDAAEAVAKSVAIAKSKRTALRGAVTRDAKSVEDAFVDITDKNMLSAELHLAKLRRHEKLLSEYDRIVEQDPGLVDIESELDKQLEYQTKLTEAIDLLSLKIRRAQEEAKAGGAVGGQISVLSSHDPAPTLRPKLPTLELTEYDGDPLKWEEFWDDFECTIDSRTDLSPIEKFKLLKKSLKKDAESLADGYHLTQRNYEEVKAALKDRFGDPQVAIFAHFEALLELEPASHEVEQLVRIRDKCEAHIRSLAALGLSEDTFGMVFAPILLSKLPRFVKMEMHRRNGSKHWTLTALREHLKEEIRVRSKSDRGFCTHPVESEAFHGKETSNLKSQKKHMRSTSTLLFHGKKQEQGKNQVISDSKQTPSTSKAGKIPWPCAFCGEWHYSADCGKYPSVEARLSRLNGRCFRCLSKDHRKDACKSTKGCRICGKLEHHSSLCYQQNKKGDKSKTLDPTAPEYKPKDGVHTIQGDGQAHAVEGRRGTVVLESATVVAQGAKGKTTARIVFDTGSTLSFIRSEVAAKIGAQGVGKDETMLCRFGDASHKGMTHSKVKIQLLLRDGSIMSLVLRKVDTVSAPMTLVPIKLDPRFPSEDLAEVLVDAPESATIDILLGLDYYYDIVGPEVWRSNDGLVIKQTAVGKVVTGCMKELHDPKVEHGMLILSNTSSTSSDLMNLERFWQIEEVGVTDSNDKSDDEHALQRFNDTIEFRDGRYQVRWPFKEDPPVLPDIYAVAVRRLNSVYRKLRADSQLLRTYDQNFADQLSKGVIERAPQEPEGVVHYLPHHAVVTPSKETTKVRVVFDASSKPSTSECSLNEAMYRGPVFLNDLCGLLLRFQLPVLAVVSDVEKAFLQISLQRDHRDCTRFLWLKDVSRPPSPGNLVVYRYVRVLFGAKGSPFLLAATILHHLLQHAGDNAVASQISISTYMDNVFGSSQTTGELWNYYLASKQLFASMSMNLRQWYSNDAEFMRRLPDEDRGGRKTTSVLGLKWDIDADTLQCSTGTISTTPVTKRQVLQSIASIFDPCGWYAPVTISGKLLMQCLWKLKIKWDEKLPMEQQAVWSSLIVSFNKLNSHKLPRRLFLDHKPDSCEFSLHVFCDASSAAYAACVFLCAEDNHSKDSKLILAKSRVAPVKTLSIPRLELLAALIGSRLVVFVEQNLHLPIRSKTLWSDSRCVLSWIESKKVLTTFAENRVRQIRNIQGLKKRYVSTKQNPADLATRGLSFENLVNNPLWWNGPPWLMEDESSWPNEHVIEETLTKVEEEESIRLVTAAETEKVFDLSRYSSLNRLLRVTCYVLRICNKIRGKPLPKQSLTASEVANARMFWIKRVQQQNYGDFLAGKASSNNLVKQLGLYKDGKDLIRCRGRYQNATDLDDSAKYPILLPKDHKISELIVKNCHTTVMHFGVKHTLAKVRENFWICQGPSFVKKILSDCKVCRIAKGGPYRAPEAAPLPSFRASISRPFEATGLDYIGPLFVKKTSGTEKVWIVIFTCATMRAVHLEVVESLAAADFLLSLRRFVALYGKPAIIVSDNAKQLKVADQVLKKEFKRLSETEEVQDYAAMQGIEWKFIVEKAPWMGGFFERLVATVKESLKKTLGSWTVKLSELQTVVYEAAFVINSRPLTITENDPGETVITPLDLLFKSPSCFPDGSGEEVMRERENKVDNLIRHWRAGQNLLREFWEVWKSQYLLSLRSNWRQETDRGCSKSRPEIGDVVLVKESLPRGMWRMGKITELRKSADGEIRAAKLLMTNGSSLLRPIKLLHPIESSVAFSKNSNSDRDEKEKTGHNEDETLSADRRPKRKAAEDARQKNKRVLFEA